MDDYKKAKEALETTESLIKELNIINIEGAIINRKIRISGNLAIDLALQLYNRGVTDEIVKSGKYDNLISNFVKSNGIKDINLELNNEVEPVVEDTLLAETKNNEVEAKEEIVEPAEVVEIIEPVEISEITESVYAPEISESKEVKTPTLVEPKKSNFQELSQNYAMNGSALDQLEKTGVYYYRELKNLNTSKIKDPSIGNIVVGIKKATAELKARLANVNINKFVQNSSPELGMSR